jgi:predicted nucleic acid-binding protein
VASSRLAYLDASALVKLALREHETQPLRRHLRGVGRRLTNEIAVVEVMRAARIADPTGATLTTAREVLEETDLVSLDRALVHRAAELATSRLRSLDAIHLATALEAAPDELVAYDRRLLEAAEASGLRTVSPR